VPTRKLIALRDLEPRWLPEETRSLPGGGSRFQMGIDFLCPWHGDHRLELWFSEPLDAGEPEKGVPLYLVDTILDGNGEMLERITVLHRRISEEPIEFEGHGALWVVGGAVLLRSH
jgi:hypothetical protein